MTFVCFSCTLGSSYFSSFKSLRIKSVADDTSKILKDDPTWQTIYIFFAGIDPILIVHVYTPEQPTETNINMIKKSGNNTEIITY